MFKVDPVTGPLLSAFFTYGLPALLLGAALSLVGAKAEKWAKQKRQEAKTKSFPALQPLPELKLTARRVLTPREEQMFFALSAALPECTILSQVSFQALLDTPSFDDRNRFNRKYADFVICSKRLTTVAIVELDDSTHDSKKAADKDRDLMLQNAGYQTVRYRDIPTTAKIREDMQSAITRLKAAHCTSN